MAQDGASGLQFEMDGENEGEAEGEGEGEEEEEESVEVNPEVIEEQFKQLYAQMPELKDAYDIEQLTLEEKYQILVSYTDQEEEEETVIEHEGKQYRKVQLQGHDGEFLMDEDENIYDLELNKLGNAEE